MRITRLRLSGFKSFVEPAELLIEPGLTGVVGPNGCGKSNLLEAIRWVMGETSARSLRGGGMDDVIFAGTARRPARDFAEVALAGEVRGDDWEVVRRIERGAGSGYRLNGRDVRARDVALHFADAATGAHSPALVSQGRISAVIAAKPADRRMMLEEAAGIAGLHVRRREAEQRLRATEANLERLGELIAAGAARVAALRRQARAAERYKALSEAIRVAEARLIWARWRDASAAAEAAKLEADAAEMAVAQAGGTLAAAQARQGEAQAALAATRAEALTRRDAAAAALHARSAAEAERQALDRQLRTLGEDEARLAADRAREGTLAGDAAAAIARLTEERARLGTRIAEAAEQRPRLEAALAEAERTARDAEVALANAVAAAAGEAAEARVAEAALAAARSRADRAERDAAALAAEAARAGVDTDFAAERARAAETRAAALAEVEAARAAIAAGEAEDRHARERRDTAGQALAGLRAERAALVAEQAALEKATRTDGGRDRLLDRVRAAPGYERALAAALGDDLEAGLDPAAPRHWGGAGVEPGDPPPPPGAEPLGRHVEAPGALARRLAQVLVAESDDGWLLAPGQRLVTLAGAMRRWDGFHARGGGAAAAERLERRNRLAAMAALIAPLEERVAAAEREGSAAEAAVKAAQAAAVAARTALGRADVAAREAGRAEDRATAAAERAEVRARDLAERRARLESERTEAAAERARAEAGMAALPDRRVGEERVRTMRAAAEAARAAVARAAAARSALEQARAADAERLAAAEAEVRSWRARAGDAARRGQELAARAEALEATAASLADRPAALAAALTAAQDEAARAAAAAEDARQAESVADLALRAAEAEAARAAEAVAAARERRAGAAARAEAEGLRRVELGRLSGERFQCPPVLLPERAGFAGAEVEAPQAESQRHDRLMADRERLGPVNLVAATELAEAEAEAGTQAAERAELEEAVRRLRGSVGALNREGRQRLLAAFEAVDGHFRRLFATLFQGGQAHLSLIEAEDPLEAGLEIMAQPPGKRLQSLTLLSGGEQALTAVALIFALFLTNPAPICVLDEVDAPLDDANIDRFCDLLDRMVGETDTRYLIVTHNAVTMSRMHRLFGVTMVEQGVSRLVSVDLGGAETLLAAE